LLLYGAQEREILWNYSVDEPASNQPTFDISEDTTPGDLDNTPPELPKGSSAPHHDGDDEESINDPTEQQTPPPAPDPVPRSKAKS
jgi:hypothetical protein